MRLFFFWFLFYFSFLKKRKVTKEKTNYEITYFDKYKQKLEYACSITYNKHHRGASEAVSHISVREVVIMIESYILLLLTISLIFFIKEIKK